MKNLKRLAAIAIIGCFCALSVGCTNSQMIDVPITEKLIDYGDGSEVYFPVVTGLKNKDVEKSINQELEKKLTENYKKIDKDQPGTTMEGFTAFYGGTLLSIFQEGYYYIDGAANGQNYMSVLHVDTNTGKFFELKDLFKENMDPMPILKEIVSKKLQTKLEENFISQSVPIEKANFDVYDNKLTLIFSPYDVAPRSMGFVDVQIDFVDIQDFINTNGELYKAFTTYENGAPVAANIFVPKPKDKTK